MDAITINKKAKRDYRVLCLVILSVFAMGQCTGSIDAGISKIADVFSLPMTTALYVTTVASLVGMACSFSVGFIAGRKIGYRKVIVFCAVAELLGSLLPFFATNFTVLILIRVLFGIGYGGLVGLENTVLTLLVGEKKRATVLGLATFAGFGVNCLLQFIGGVLTDIQWNYVFLTHLILVLPFFVILLLFPEIEVEDQKDRQEKLDLRPQAVGMCVMMLLAGIMISPLLIGCSFLSAAIIDSATVAGFIAVCFSVGCTVGGLLYSFIYRWLSGRCIVLALVLCAIGCMGSALAETIPMLAIMIFIGGIGFSQTQASGMMVIGLVSSGHSVAVASAAMMSLFSFGIFLSTYFEAAIGAVTGDALYLPLYIGTLLFLGMAAVLWIKNPFPKPGSIMEKSRRH